MTDISDAYRELLDTLAEVHERFAGPEWGIEDPDDVAEATRTIMHLLQTGLLTQFDDDPDHPTFRPIVAPWRKAMGDNPDAIYFDAAVADRNAYRVTGNLAGATYTSLTVEVGGAGGGFPEATGGVLNDTQFDVAADGSYEVFLGGDQRDRNWLPLPQGASRITTRHYFENETPAAAPPWPDTRLFIESVNVVPPPTRPSGESVTDALRRMSTFVRARTLDQAKPGDQDPPDFVSRTPNQFPPPVKPGTHALAAADAAYSMAPYLLGPDEALVMSGRWPTCRFGNVSLWNRHLQTFDYVNRPVARNRTNTALDSDGSFRMVIAHEDPGMPNWIDTEGRAFGMVFWRFMLPEGEIDTPRAEVVKFADL